MFNQNKVINMVKTNNIKKNPNLNTCSSFSIDKSFKVNKNCRRFLFLKNDFKIVNAVDIKGAWFIYLFHFSIECLILDTVGPITHQAVQTN